MAQLTNDRRQLYASIDCIRYVPGRTGLTWYTPVNRNDPDLVFQDPIKGRLDAARSPCQSIGTLSALAYAIQGLREMPGAKGDCVFFRRLPSPYCRACAPIHARNLP
jgi:hypothetical protein